MMRRTIRKRTGCRAEGFTLIELLVVITIVAALAAMLLPVFSAVQNRGNETKTMSNMRQMGVALLSYAGDNSYNLPNRVQPSGNGAPDADKWPRVLHPYIQDLRAYGSPVPDIGGKSYKVDRPEQYLDNGTNYTSYIYNGGNDVQEEGADTAYPRLNNISSATEVILLGIPYPRANNFYMDFREKNNDLVLNKTAFQNGSPYVFCDGSARMLKAKSGVSNTERPPDGGTYSDWLWLFQKEAAGIIQ